MSKVVLFRSERFEKKHIAIPNSVTENLNPSRMVSKCGHLLKNGCDVKTYDSIEEAVENEEVCKQCLITAGFMKSPKLDT